MRSFLLLCALIGIDVAIQEDPLQLSVHHGFTQIHELPHPSIISSYVINNQYTFEISLSRTTNQDYMVDSCKMNGETIIGEFGCVQCGQCVTESIETESYNREGAIKRTLVHFIARSTNIEFKCQIRRIQCSGCAERSCQRKNQIPLSHFASDTVTLMYPPGAYAGSASFPVGPPPPPIYPTPFFGHQYPIPPHEQPIGAAPSSPVGGASSGGREFAGWPWWLWLLLLLLLLLLLCCLLCLCLAAWMKKRKDKKKTTTTTTVVVDAGKDAGVGTEKVAVHCVSTDTQDIVKCQPAVIVGNSEEYGHHSSRSRHHYDEGAAIAGGSYSLREGRIHEGYTRTLPRDGYSAERYDGREHFERNAERDERDRGRYADRSSYRNFAYERDLGRVEPLDGYDEVETRERTYCMSDDEQEIIEKEVKRTHTTRFAQETREFETGDERYRGEEHAHAPYTHSLPV